MFLKTSKTHIRTTLMAVSINRLIELSWSRTDEELLENENTWCGGQLAIIRGQGNPYPRSDWSVLDRCGGTGASVIGHARSCFP